LRDDRVLARANREVARISAGQRAIRVSGSSRGTSGRPRFASRKNDIAAAEMIARRVQFVIADLLVIAGARKLTIQRVTRSSAPQERSVPGVEEMRVEIRAR